ncbi:MAG: haloalkane dehalogenase [Pseudomonadota bacterium]
MSDWGARKQFVEVHGHRMAWVEMGAGDPIVFIHGNPTSSYLWRDVMGAMEGAERLLAPDLIGMGDSDKLPDSGPDGYTLAEHARFLDGWFDAVVPEGRVTLVIHDWGGALGFRWARLNAHRVAGIAYMETLPRPLAMAEWPENIRGLFGALRSEAGEDMILNKNVFVERILPGSVLRDLTEDEMTEYRRPFAEPGEDRRPTLTWPRQIPLDNQPPESTATIAENWTWLSAWDGPKLLVDAEPGAIMKGAVLDDVRELSNQREVSVAGSHFIQEDSGAEIGRAIADWKAGF